jgi:hypothetical protein
VLVAIVALAFPANVTVVPEIAVTVDPKNADPTMSVLGTLSTMTLVLAVELLVTLTFEVKFALVADEMFALALPASVMLVPLIEVIVEPSNEDPTTKLGGTFCTTTPVPVVELDVTTTCPKEAVPSIVPPAFPIRFTVPPLSVTGLLPSRFD